MNQNSSPLEYLSAFAITFAAGMLTSAALSTYAQWLQRRAASTQSD
jgi:hypothetical protein